MSLISFIISVLNFTYFPFFSWSLACHIWVSFKPGLLIWFILNLCKLFGTCFLCSKLFKIQNTLESDNAFSLLYVTAVNPESSCWPLLKYLLFDTMIHPKVLYKHINLHVKCPQVTRLNILLKLRNVSWIQPFKVASESH